ncbi:MAG TPA: glucosidase [Rubrivivax sp.]|nr:glucosidase [Rubrivivax sp.]
MTTTPPTAEDQRLADARERDVPWRRWGPYVSERQWGTVREDYSPDGDAWGYLPHEQARSRAYRWGEDGIAGICDEQQHLCFALTLWNGADPILKERLFGLTGVEGNHGEDVKECYFHLDNLPSHAYMKFLYKYPQQAFPYEQLLQENRRRSRLQPEYELLDTGIFDDDRYFDVFVEYAKAGTDDLLVRISAHNRGADTATLHLLPTLWFRNTWSWTPGHARPLLQAEAPARLAATHPLLEPYWLHFDAPEGVLFTDNESNRARLWGQPNEGFAKDGFDDHLVQGRANAVNPAQRGTKAAPHYRRELAPGEAWVIRLRLTADGKLAQPLGADFDALFAQRIEEADSFYRRITPFEMPDDLRNVQRQAFAGLLWSKQYYHYFVERWLGGDAAGPKPPAARQQGRNHGWRHLDAADVMAMPDKWEYPWFASWDMAFHCVAFALIDADFAKQQLTLLTREWYMHPNGQIPAYEWNFGDVNPPVHAWAAIRICQIEQKMTGRMDRLFLERIFQKLLINFTWWVNRKDEEGNNLFEGGFLGLDNVSAFDRSAQLPSGGRLEQADGTSWMATYCLNMLVIALELASDNPAYEDVATKFFEHFVYIGAAVNRDGEHGPGLWSEDQGYYFDLLKLPDGRSCRIDAVTIAGLIPLFAIAVGDAASFRGFKDFRERFTWFRQNRPELLGNLADLTQRGVHQRIRLALVDAHKLQRMLAHVLDPAGLLSPHGVRSVSRRHAEHPFVLRLEGQEFKLDYEPAESHSAMFGGNSNWRGPVWMPLNFLLIEALQKHDYFLGDAFQVRCGEAGETASMWQVAADLSRRLIGLFTRGADGRRPVHGRYEKFQTDPHWKDLVLFYEYFDGDTGMGLGASHQTGWTALVAKLIQQHAEYTLQHRTHEVKPVFGTKGTAQHAG